ncbi:MAG: DUF4350 domain-containing protein [Candidatus Poseidoniia archaeon]|nr:DUF4350 domain-containing protein [Candidatus Poseidoniia archaeon]MDP6846994.1 DUF4350 domain-containing protein [Candidatus Poseidoniia archaeon]MDP7007660.1 DUF4350 domain-containing protein [Candidatus Poseidoniia archaeon]
MGDLKLWWDRYGLKLTALVAAALIIGAIYPQLASRSQNPSQLSAWDSDWNDLSRFADDMEARGYTTQSLLSSPQALGELTGEQRNSTVLVILGVERAYTEPEAKAIHEFVKQGGRVLLADDFGHGNSAVSGLYSVGASFFGNRLYDRNHWEEAYHPHNSSYVIVDAAITHYGFSGQLLLSEPTALTIAEGGKAIPLARSSVQAFVDLDGDGIGDSDEGAFSIGGAVVMAEVEIGSGRMVMLSDPSLFINSLYDELDNREFARALIDSLAQGSNATLLFDESRHLQPDFLSLVYVQLFGYVVFAGSNEVARIIFLAAILLGAEVALMRTRNPLAWRHLHNLYRGRSTNYRVPHAHYVHPDTIREVFLNRVRIEHGYSREEFDMLSGTRLEELLGDETLVRFIVNRDAKLRQEQVLKAISRWSK